MTKRRRSFFRSRRSKKIAPGVRVTSTKKGPGISVKTPLGSYSTRTGKIRRRKKKSCCLLMLLIFLATVFSLGCLCSSSNRKSRRVIEPAQWRTEQPTKTPTPTRTPRPTKTPTPTATPTNTPTPTAISTSIPTELPPTDTPIPPTDTPLPQPPPPPPTNTPAPPPPPPIPTPAPPSAPAVCDCSGDLYNCSDFATHSEAQACFDHCKSLGRGDIHRLDRNHNDLACE